jgi:hypothetical protein
VTRKSELAIWFTPEAIRQHFEGADTELEEWVNKAKDAQLKDVGLMAMNWEHLWEEFHKALVDAVEWGMGE